MAQEQARGCGLRYVGGMYLVGEAFGASCDRLPFPLSTCPTCGHGIKVSKMRNLKLFESLEYFGDAHEHCHDEQNVCYVCTCKRYLELSENAPQYVIMVGSEYTPQEFMLEGMTQGISKRIPFLPTAFIVGQSVVYLAHPKAIALDARGKHQAGIIGAFRPQRVEMPVWEKDADDKVLKHLEKRGITPVIFKKDPDHKVAPNYKKMLKAAHNA